MLGDIGHHIYRPDRHLGLHGRRNVLRSVEECGLFCVYCECDVAYDNPDLRISGFVTI